MDTQITIDKYIKSLTGIMELSLPGAKVPWYGIRSLELSFPGTFTPGSESSKNF